MKPLCYFTASFVEVLRKQASKSLDWYFGEREKSPTLTLSKDQVRTSELKFPDFACSLYVDPSNPSRSDAQNALVVYKSLKELSSHQASIERLWVYLCHCICPDYVTARWFYQRPKDRDAMVRQVRNHFFATGNRALIRDNGVSRLWWLGKIAHDVEPDEPSLFLEILLYRQDVRAALIERSSMSMNRQVLRGIYLVMREQWYGDCVLFARNNFRAWMIALNRRGGVILLDSLPEEELRRLLVEELHHILT